MGSTSRLSALVGPFLLVLLFAALQAARLPFTHPVSRQQDVPRVPPNFNLNSGGPAVGRFVQDLPWVIGDTSASDLPDAMIGGADEINAPMYNSHRYGVDGSTWGYDIPVQMPGVYGCTVHFAETDSASFKPGARVFDIIFSTAAGEPIRFEEIDIFAEKGNAEFTVLTKTAEGLVIPGIFSVRAIPRKGDAIISGLTCERTDDLPDGVSPDYETTPPVPQDVIIMPSMAASAEPDHVIHTNIIDINAGGEAIGRFQEEDYSWIFGDTSSWGGPPGAIIGGAEERNTPALISQRYGVDGSTWGYRIPVEKRGKYECSVHFAETDSAAFKKGARIFDVEIMDQILPGLDVYAEADLAPFTAIVKTFSNLKVGSELVLKFTPVKGNAFLSALTCEKTAELDADEPLTEDSLNSYESPEPSVAMHDEDMVGEGLSPTPSMAMEPSTAATPLVESPSGEMPPPDAPGPGGLETAVPSPTPVTPTVTVFQTPQPSIESPADVPGSTTEEPIPSTEALGNLDVPPTEDPPKDVDSPSLDSELIAGEGQRRADYRLLATVTGGDSFTEDMKNALKAESQEFSSTAWAMDGLQEETIQAATRQNSRVFQVDIQTLFASEEFDSEARRYAEFVSKGDLNSELRNTGLDNLSVELEQAPQPVGASSGPTEASTSSTSRVVGIVVGCVLGVLVIAAVVVFAVVRRSRGTDMSGNGFDAPPPMTESEMSSVMDRSETAASVEYLDDDSTFTAATSRAGDHVDQVAFDKDVFGRGTATGSHGVS